MIFQNIKRTYAQYLKKIPSGIKPVRFNLQLSNLPTCKPISNP